jgi:hypothetical protein
LFKVGLGVMMVNLNLKKVMDLLVREWLMIGKWSQGTTTTLAPVVGVEQKKLAFFR